MAEISSPMTGDTLDTPYACDEPGCMKRFKRSDRLLRHKKNHENITPYPCTWPGCDKSFVRKDVRSKHLKRHVIREDKMKSRPKDSRSEIKFFEIYTPDSVRSSRQPLRPESDEYEETGDDFNGHGHMNGNGHSNGNGRGNEHGNGNINAAADANADADAGVNADTSANIHNPTDSTNPKQMDLDLSYDKSSLDYVMNTSLKQQFQPLEGLDANLETTNLIEWLLNDNQEYSSKYLDYSPSSSFKDLLGGTPDFIYSTQQSEVSPAVISELTSLIPSLRDHPYFSADHIEKYLDTYWCLYHIQFPIIHRPTFSTDKAHPLLLLSMITIGSSLTSRTTKDKMSTSKMIELSELIAQPLRWLICSHCEELSTVNSWTIQSLLVLECFEINCSKRSFHRRAHLHHGFKIELLRRSPLLGGDPSRSNENGPNLETGVWENWVELESLKRCAYIAFLVDTYNAIIFGHDTILYTHHIKLSMPFQEELWETAAINKSNLNSQLENGKFLSLITNILRRKSVKTSPLISKILLAGLISLVFQTEQNDMQSKSLRWQNLKYSWKNDLLATLDFWYDNIIDESCCQLQNAYYCPADLSTLNLSKPDDTTCKYSVYHICQAFLRLSQYDCIIYAGAPTRMNVKADSNDYQIVQERVKRWAKSSSGRLSVTHAYVLLCEILLSQDDDGNDIPVTYDPNRDPIFYRPNIVASALFLIWDYSYCLYGAEATYFNDWPSDAFSKSISFISNGGLPEKLNGYTYIQRIKRAFDEVDTSGDTSSQKFLAYANSLDKISNKHYTVGLLRLLKDRYSQCNSQICREYGKLMENCIQRSLGKREILCANMYEE